MESLFMEFNNIFSLSFVFSNITIIYTITSFLKFNPKTKTPNGDIKRIITIIVSIINGIISHYISDIPTDIIISSVMLSIVSYDYIIKKILTKFNIK